MGLCLTLLTGCAGALIVGGAAVGAGTVAYVTGELKAVEEAPLDRGWSATRKAAMTWSSSLPGRIGRPDGQIDRARRG
jgi:hypothetical protein